MLTGKSWRSIACLFLFIFYTTKYNFNYKKKKSAFMKKIYYRKNSQIKPIVSKIYLFTLN